MKKTLAVVLVVFAGVYVAEGAVPGEINFQGRLTDSGGTPISGSVDMEFELFYVETGTHPLIWTEQQTVEVTDGIFSVLLGSQTPMDPMRFMNGEMWLEVRVEGETLTPRYKMAAAPYAFVTDPDSHRHHSLEAIDGNPMYAVTVDANGDVDTVGAVNAGGDVAVTGSVQTTGDVQTAGEFTYSATRTFYQSMPFSAFQDDQPGLNTRWYLTDDYGYPNAGPLPHIVDLYAPVILPEGVTVTEVSVYYFDTRDPENLTISLELYRIPFAQVSAQTMASATTTTSGIVFKTALTQTTISNAVIDNQNYMYQLKVEFNSGDYANLSMGLFGARIAYTLDALKP